MEMKTNDIFDVLGGLVVVALATTIVSSRNTSGIVTATGRAFRDVFLAAQGKR